MAHNHHSNTSGHGRAFAIGIGLNSLVVLLEFVFGLRSHSLALLSDAGHNATDVLGLVLAGTAAMLSKRSPTERRTYGLRRSSILASLLNALFLLVIVGALSWEAVIRLNHPGPVDDLTIIAVAAIGLLLNAFTAFLFRSGHNDLNVRTAYLHMAGDAAISLGVVVAGLVIHFSGWLWLDPAVSIAISLAIAYSTWQIVVESFNLAVDAVPAGIDPPDVERFLGSLPGVCEVHDLHIWAMSTTETALTAHLVTTNPETNSELLANLQTGLHDLFGIEHSTIQIELEDPSRECALRLHAHV